MADCSAWPLQSFFASKPRERATNTAFLMGYGVDSKHSKRVPVCDFSNFQVPCPKMKNACWDNPKPLKNGGNRYTNIVEIGGINDWTGDAVSEP